jgi:hypothetical protein
MKIMQLKRYAVQGAIAAFIVFLGSATVAFATPSDEIGHAVSANDVSNVQQATAGQFIRAFSAVLMRVGAKEVPSYVSSAIKLHPDLAPPIQPPCIDAGDISTTVLGIVNPRNIPSPGPGRVSSPEQTPGP